MGDALKKFITTDLIKFGLSRIFAKTEIPNMKGILNRIKYKLQEKFGGNESCIDFEKMVLKIDKFELKGETFDSLKIAFDHFRLKPWDDINEDTINEKFIDESDFDDNDDADDDDANNSDDANNLDEANYSEDSDDANYSDDENGSNDENNSGGEHESNDQNNSDDPNESDDSTEFYNSQNAIRITDTIEIKIHYLFRILLMACKHPDTKYFEYVMWLFLPVLSNIPGIEKLFKLLKILLNGDKSELITELTSVMEIGAVLCYTQCSENMKKQLLKIDADHFDKISNWIRLVDSLLSKNTTDKVIEQQMKLLSKVLEDGIDEADRAIKDIQNHKNLQFIIGLCTGNLDMIQSVASMLGLFDNKKVKMLFDIFKEYEKVIFKNGGYGLPEISRGLKSVYLEAYQHFADERFSFGNTIKALTEGGSKLAKEGLNQLGDVAKDQIGALSTSAMQSAGSLATDLLYKDLFNMFDKDMSGYIDYSEFCDLCKYMGLHLDQEHSLKLFAMADTDQNNCIEVWEFQKAMLLIKLEIAREALKKLGLTTEDLIWFGVLTLIYLILALTFIFLGIFAFSKVEGFNAVINSLLPLCAGIAAAARNIDLKDSIEKVKDYIKSLIQKLKSMAS